MTLYIPSILHSKVCVQSGVAIPVSVVDVELVSLIFETCVCVSLDR